MNRGRCIVVTGGGKTLLEFETVRHGFFTRDFTLQVVVAPTIDLLKQHDETFAEWGLFHHDSVARIHFRTGDEARLDAHAPYFQTTNPSELFEALAQCSDRKILIFVTYASVKKLFSILSNARKIVNACMWDEFHHLIQQTDEQKRWLKTLWPVHNVFFSASEKRGRIVSSLDEELFGPKLVDIGYARLRDDGILVPNIVVKLIRLNDEGRSFISLSREMKKTADRSGFSYKDAMLEAGGCIVAVQDMLATIGNANVVTFSQQVAVSKAIASSSNIKDELVDVLIQTVHAGVPGRERKTIYERVKASPSSLLCQHSIVKEGIDITCFNALVMARNMDIIGVQQAIGRIIRADPRDTEALKAGKISLISSEGWHKYTATVYVLVKDEESYDFRIWLRDFIKKMTMSGFGINDYQFADIVEQRKGKKNIDTSWVVPLTGNVEFGIDNLRKLVSKLTIELDDEEAYAQAENKARSETNVELFADVDDENCARIVERQRRLDECYVNDSRKPVCVPCSTLAIKIIARIPLEKLSSNVMVISDLGLLVALWITLKKNRFGTAKVTFVAHTEKVAQFAQELGFRVITVPYERLDLFFSGPGEYNCQGMKFDVIVGNPPYNGVSRANVKKAGVFESFLGSGYRSHYPFIALERLLLRDNGVMMFVTPHKWLTENTAQSLREELFKDGAITFLEVISQPEEWTKKGIEVGHITVFSFCKSALEHTDKIVIDSQTKSVRVNDERFLLLQKISAISAPRVKFCYGANIDKSGDTKLETTYIGRDCKEHTGIVRLNKLDVPHRQDVTHIEQSKTNKEKYVLYPDFARAPFKHWKGTIEPMPVHNTLVVVATKFPEKMRVLLGSAVAMFVFRMNYSKRHFVESLSGTLPDITSLLPDNPTEDDINKIFALTSKEIELVNELTKTYGKDM